jgi:hypothetical protein
MSTVLNPVPLSEHDTHVQQLLSQAEGEFARAGQFLRDYGVSTELAQQASIYLKAPLEFSYQTFENLSDKTAQIIRPVVEDFLRRNAQELTISQVWFVERGDGAEHELEYTIALQEFTLEHRVRLREFRLDYLDTGLDSMVPLEFNIVPSALASNVDTTVSKELALA